MDNLSVQFVKKMFLIVNSYHIQEFKQIPNKRHKLALRVCTDKSFSYSPLMDNLCVQFVEKTNQSWIQMWLISNRDTLKDTNFSVLALRVCTDESLSYSPLMDNLCVQFVEKMCHSWHIKGSPCNLRNADSPCYRLASQLAPIHLIRLDRDIKGCCAACWKGRLRAACEL